MRKAFTFVITVGIVAVFGVLGQVTPSNQTNGNGQQQLEQEEESICSDGCMNKLTSCHSQFLGNHINAPSGPGEPKRLICFSLKFFIRCLRAAILTNYNCRSIAKGIAARFENDMEEMRSKGECRGADYQLLVSKSLEKVYPLCVPKIKQCLVLDEKLGKSKKEFGFEMNPCYRKRKRNECLGCAIGQACKNAEEVLCVWAKTQTPNETDCPLKEVLEKVAKQTKQGDLKTCKDSGLMIEASKSSAPGSISGPYDEARRLCVVTAVSIGSVLIWLRFNAQ